MVGILCNKLSIWKLFTYFSEKLRVKCSITIYVTDIQQLSKRWWLYSVKDKISQMLAILAREKESEEFSKTKEIRKE